EAGIDEIDRRPGYVLETRDAGRQLCVCRQIRPRLEARDRRRLGIDGEDGPTAPQQLDGVAAVAAAKIDGAAAVAVAAQILERQQQRAPRRPSTRPLVIVAPVAVALSGRHQGSV